VRVGLSINALLLLMLQHEIFIYLDVTSIIIHCSESKQNIV